MRTWHHFDPPRIGWKYILSVEPLSGSGPTLAIASVARNMRIRELAITVAVHLFHFLPTAGQSSCHAAHAGVNHKGAITLSAPFGAGAQMQDACKDFAGTHSEWSSGAWHDKRVWAKASSARPSSTSALKQGVGRHSKKSSPKSTKDLTIPTL